MPSHRTFRIATWIAASVLAPIILLCASSFLFTLSRISLAGTTIKLDRGKIYAYWLWSPVPWASSVPAPGWHIHRGPQGLRFSGKPATA